MEDMLLYLLLFVVVFYFMKGSLCNNVTEGASFNAQAGPPQPSAVAPRPACQTGSELRRQVTAMAGNRKTTCDQLKPLANEYCNSFSGNNTNTECIQEGCKATLGDRGGFVCSAPES